MENAKGTYVGLTTISGIYLEGRDQLNLAGGVLARNPDVIDASSGGRGLRWILFGRAIRRCRAPAVYIEVSDGPDSA